MYDAGGISLKPSDAMHAAMKQDMSGAAAVLGSMLTLRDLGCTTAVTGYLMCTDNMPSGKAMRLGDVLTIRGGMTVEVFNTDAEGRLVMADALVLATELDPPPDAIVTIATLTGAAMRTFGTALAATLGNDPGLVDQIEAAGARTDEPVWELPLVKRYRRKLDSAIADIKNLGGENAGTITAGLFLEEFTGDIPFGHLDICGPMMTDADDSWRSIGRDGVRHPSAERSGHALPAATGLTGPAIRRTRYPGAHRDGSDRASPAAHVPGPACSTPSSGSATRCPHPAIIFIILIAGVIVLSQILYIVGASVTYEVVAPPPVVGEQGYPPGSAVEVPSVPPAFDYHEEDLHVEHETTAVNGLLTADGIRFMFTSPVANFNNFGVVGIILVAMLGVGLAEEAGLIGALIRLLVRVVAAPPDHVHHRADRDPVERRDRRRLPGPDPAGGGRLPQHGPAPAGRPGGRLRRGRRGVRGQPADRADRRDHDRGRERVDRAGRPDRGRSRSPPTTSSPSSRRSSSRSSSRS